MARGMNKVMIIGFVERDPELRHTANGQPVASFSVSTSRRWTISMVRRTARWMKEPCLRC